MKLLFCNIMWFDYYKGIIEGIDMPQSGGAHAAKIKDALEKYNFEKVHLDFPDDSAKSGEYCLGYVETKQSKSNKNQLYIEKMDGCEECTKENQIDDVLVIYCAKHPAYGFTTVVGWYNHATVFRNYQEINFSSGNTEEEVYVQQYNAIAKAEDCILLPHKERSKKSKWSVPRKQTGAIYGFGQSNVWFPQKKEFNQYQNEFIERIVKQIQEYEEENWLEKYPEKV